MLEKNFQPGQYARVISEPGRRKDDEPGYRWAHFVNQNSIVEIIKFEETPSGRGFHIFAKPECFSHSPEENGLFRFGYEEGVQFILETELEPVALLTNVPKKNPAQLPEI